MTVRHLTGGSGLIEASVIRSFGGFEHQHSGHEVARSVTDVRDLGCPIRTAL